MTQCITKMYMPQACCEHLECHAEFATNKKNTVITLILSLTEFSLKH